MNIKLELSVTEIAEFIKEKLNEKEFDISQLVDAKAIQILQEIQDVLAWDDLSDFGAIEKIVCIFENHNLSTGGRHDFG